MMLFFFCLLAAFPAVSTKSPIFGPREVSKMKGSSASIKCFYPATSVNRHTRKYWCRQGHTGTCTTLISSQSYISTDYKDRAKLTDFPESNTFVVDIFNLTEDDSGHYKCGLGINTRGLSFDVSLNVSHGDTEIHKAELGGTVKVVCPFKFQNAPKLKSVCKQTDHDCLLVIDSTGYINPDYSNRVQLNITGGTKAKNFTFIIKQLQPTDSGMYVCKAGDPPKDDKKKFYIQLPGSEPPELNPSHMREPELAYGDLRGSVTIDCALDHQVAKGDKFLCRRNNGEDCDVVINTQGEAAPAFEGRILLTPKDGGSFSVMITNLRKEDAGDYFCGEPQEGKPTQVWQLFVNEETTMPLSPSVVKGVEGGSVAVRCPYNPKDKNSVKYWCRWENGHCSSLVQSDGLSQGQEEAYKGRLALFEEPGNGTYTVILNQLTTKDAGYYWCFTNGDMRWTSMVELKIVEGKPTLKVPESVTVSEGDTTKISCHVPCKFYSYEKYWCKWTTKGCTALPTQDVGSSQPSVNCDQKSQLIDLILSPVTKENEGWYWCGVKNNLQYEETAAVYVTVQKRVKVPQDIRQENAVPGEKAIDSSVREIENKATQDANLGVDSNVRKIENKAIQDANLVVEDRTLEEIKNPADGSRASTDTGSSTGHGRSTTVLVSTLVPLALVLAVGAVALGVARARHRRNVDRISIRSYKTDISMSDFENSRDFGGNDNMGASPFNQETPIEGNNESITTTEETVETQETKKTKRSSKEEADMAYTNFLLQSNNIAANVHERLSEV